MEVGKNARSKDAHSESRKVPGLMRCLSTLSLRQHYILDHSQIPPTIE